MHEIIINTYFLCCSMKLKILLYTKVFTLFPHRKSRCAKLSVCIEDFWPLGNASYNYWTSCKIIDREEKFKTNWKFATSTIYKPQEWQLCHWYHNTNPLVLKHYRDYNQEVVPDRISLCYRQRHNQICETWLWKKKAQREKNFIKFYSPLCFIIQYLIELTVHNVQIV